MGKGEANQHQKHHIAHTIVEQAFTGNLRLQRLGQIGFAEHAQNGHRICRRNQRAEYQRRQQWHARDPGEAKADNHCRQGNPQGSHQEDHLPLCTQIPQFHMQRPGKQQQAQHAFQQSLGKVDAGHDAAHRIGNP